MDIKDKNKIKNFLLVNYDLKVTSFRSDKFNRNGYFFLKVKHIANEEVTFEINIAKIEYQKYLIYLNGLSGFDFETISNSMKRLPFILKNIKIKEMFNMINDVNSFLEIFLEDKFSVKTKEPLKTTFYSYSFAYFNIEDKSIEVIDKIQFSLFNNFTNDITIFEILDNKIKDVTNYNNNNIYFYNVDDLKEFMTNNCNSILNKAIIEGKGYINSYNINAHFNLNHFEIDKISEIPLLIENNFKLFSILMY